MADRAKVAREWLCSGGNGHEDGEDGIRAMRIGGESLVEFLAEFGEYLLLAERAPEPEGTREPFFDQLAIDVARETYDRFVMGGWTPADMHAQLVTMFMQFWESVGESPSSASEQVLAHSSFIGNAISGGLCPQCGSRSWNVRRDGCATGNAHWFHIEPETALTSKNFGS